MSTLTRQPPLERSLSGRYQNVVENGSQISRRRSSFISKNSSVEQIAFADPEEQRSYYQQDDQATPRARSPAAKTPALANKASLNALTVARTHAATPKPRTVQSVSSLADRIDKDTNQRRISSPRISDISMADQEINIEVGDPVDVPGGMTGTVRFVGMVRGKKGMFAGIELDREYAARGKNDGDVEGYAVAAESLCQHNAC